MNSVHPTNGKFGELQVVQKGSGARLGSLQPNQAPEEITLPAPTQVSPSNFAVYGNTPTFEWTPVEGADHYVLHSNRLDPAEMVIVEDVYGTTFTPAEPLADGTVYHWRVQAVADDGAERRVE